MHDAWTDRLSEHLDGTLEGEERALIEAHLATCADCPGVLADLKVVRDTARALPPRPPAVDLWPGIEAQVTAFARGGEAFPSAAPRRRGLVSFSWPQLAAAGFALVLLSGGAAWYAAKSGGAGAPFVATGGAGDSARTQAAQASSAGVVDRQLATDLDQLERVLAEKRAELDPETVRTIENNLAIIDLATAQARAALASDPANPYLQEHLSKTMRRKIEMLKEATVLASAQ
jgi:hypothetical protein